MDEESRQLVEDCFLRPVASAKVGNNTAKAEEPAKPTHKSELQVLRLKPQFQENILETLRHIHGPLFKFADRSSYKEKGTRIKKGYWEQRGNLVIQSVSDFSNIEKSSCQTVNRFKMLSLSKLASFGFDNAHCMEALEHCKDNVDHSIELLYRLYFPEAAASWTDRPTDVSEADALESREGEKDALESIYDNDTFEEKEPKHVWLIKLKLDYLLMYSESERKKQALASIEQRKRAAAPVAKKVAECRNFVASGKCKYGDRCKFMHTVKSREVAADPNMDVNWFFVEIRFPQESFYPYTAPIVSFKTTVPDFPSGICLRITRRILVEAISLAKDGMPSVYSIADLLQNESDIMQFMKNDRSVFPDPKRSIFYVPDAEEEGQGSQRRKLPSHYKKGNTGRSDRQSMPVEQMLRDDFNISRRHSNKKNDQNYQNIMKSRRNLPAWSMKDDVLKIINESPVSVVSGETGCGKSTQVPQYILDQYFGELASHNDLSECRNIQPVSIICTQPRRLTAIAIAERVANERCERVGNVIGYQIRLENKISAATRLTFCTTGLLLRRLQSDPMLEGISHIIVDEVHERSEESDFLLLILKELLTKRSNLRVILMSATLNAAIFSDYFKGTPVLDIPGRTFGVDQFFLEDILERTRFVMEQDSKFARSLTKDEYHQLEQNLEDVLIANASPPIKLRDERLSLVEMYARYRSYSRTVCKSLFQIDPKKINSELIECVLRHIVDDASDWPQEGTILVFLPGLGEIQTVHEALSDSSVFSVQANRFIIVPLHSTLTNEEQALVFKKAPAGKRKIVLTTNIAETSITIDDCVFVIDCGQMKEKRFDSNRNMESLDLTWVSRANAMQRKGRAGRVRPGICVHLYTRHRFTHHFLGQPIPEIQRVPLDQLLLRIKTLPNFAERRIANVLASILEPPSHDSIAAAVKSLQDVGAFDDDQNLTALGEILAQFPVDVRIGKLMVYGAIFQSVDSILTIAACLSHKSPFVSPFAKRQESDRKKKEFSLFNSDHLTALRAYKKWLETYNRSSYAGRRFAEDNYLSWKTLNTIIEIKHQYLELLVANGFVSADLRQRGRNYRVSDTIGALSGAEMNRNGENYRLLAGLLCAALYPNVAKVFTPEKSYTMTAGGAIPRVPLPNELKFKTSMDGYVAVHPSSVNSVVGNFTSPFLVYQEKVKTSRIYLRDCTMVSLLPMVLFSGGHFRIEMHGGEFIMMLDDWIIIQAETHEVAESIKCLREELSILLEEKIADPSLNLLGHVNGRVVIETLINIIAKE